MNSISWTSDLMITFFRVSLSLIDFKYSINIFISLMKKFSRTNPANKSMNSLTPMRVHTEPDNDDSYSSSSIRNSLAKGSSEIINKDFGQAFRSLVLIAALRRKNKKSLEQGFAKLKENIIKLALKKRKIVPIFTISSKIDQTLRSEAWVKIKAKAFKAKLQKQGLQITENCMKIVSKRFKNQFMLKLNLLTQSSMKVVINELKQKGVKYEQNKINTESMDSLRKFQKLNTKNIKNYQRHSEQILIPTLGQICEQLPQRRIKKSIKSDTQILLHITQNQNELILDLGKKLNDTEEETKKMNESKSSMQKEMGLMTLDKNNTVKDLRKFDMELIQKNEGVLNNPTVKNVFKPLLKILQVQRTQCSRKQQNYIYASRILILQILENYVNKYMDAVITSDSSLPSLKNMKKTHSVISEKGGIEESGIIEEVIRDLSRVMNCYGENLGSSVKSASTRFNSDSLTEMMNLKEMVKEIEEIFKKMKTEIEDLERQLLQQTQINNTLQKGNEANNNQQQKIKSLEQKLKSLEKANKEKDNEISQLKTNLINKDKQIKLIQQNSQEQNNKSQQLEIQLNRIIEEKRESDEIVKLAKEQYKRFKKILKSHDQSAKDREKSVKKLITPKISAKSHNNFFSAQNSKYQSEEGDECIRKRGNSSSSNDYLGKKNKIAPSWQNTIDFDSYDRIISGLKTEIESLRYEIDYKNTQIQNAENQLISSENIITLIYNILVKSIKSPENSQKANEIWHELVGIKEDSAHLDLLESLEAFSVLCLQKNLIVEFENKLFFKNKELSQLLINMNNLKKELQEEQQVQEQEEEQQFQELDEARQKLINSHTENYEDTPKKSLIRSNYPRNEAVTIRK